MKIWRNKEIGRRQSILDISSYLIVNQQGIRSTSTLQMQKNIVIVERRIEVHALQKTLLASRCNQQLGSKDHMAIYSLAIICLGILTLIVCNKFRTENLRILRHHRYK